jgi:hypothetical protein
MFTAKRIRELFKKLNTELAKLNAKGEIGLCGGAVMCLVFKTREATKDVDAIFEPTREIREAARRVAADNALPEDWLNDAAKGFFLTDPPRQLVLDFPHLRVWAPSADYMLAMKCISARFDTFDRDDVIFLIKHLELKRAEDVFRIIEKYYPRKTIPPKTEYFIEEVFEKLS